MSSPANSADTDVIRRIGTRSSEGATANNFPAVKANEIALMFSGGVDSTATAILLAERYERVHLVTYRNGYGHYYHHRTERRVHELNRALGERFVHTLISTKSYFDEITVNNVLADYRQYRSGFIWFM